MAENFYSKLEEISPIPLEEDVVIPFLLVTFPVFLWIAFRVLLWDYQVCSCLASVPCWS